MAVWRSWLLVDGVTLAVGVLSVVLWSLPPGIAAESDMDDYRRSMILAGIAWLVLSLVQSVAAARAREAR